MDNNSRTFGNIRDYIKRVKQNANKFSEDVKVEAQREYEEVKKEIFKEYGGLQQEKVREIFQRVVNDFYSDYKPSDLYSRQYGLRNESLLSLQLDDYGRVSNNTFESYFNEEAMHADRRGNVLWHGNGEFTSLFDLTFMHGWHGGAADSEDGTHPNPGTPYYRKPHPYYSVWGDKAAYQSDPSPFESFKMMLEDMNKPGGELRQAFSKIKQKHYSKFGEKLSEEIVPRLSLKYFGKL